MAMKHHGKESDKVTHAADEAAEATPATEQGGVAVDESGDEHMHDLDSLKSMVEKMQRDRQFHEDSLVEIDKGLMEVRGFIDEITGDAGKASESAERQGNGSRTRGTRNGKETGTSIILRILRDNKGSMESPDLLKAAEAEGVSSAYSSLYSLQQTKKVHREGRTIKLPAELPAK